jgi:hypothetical protein
MQAMAQPPRLNFGERGHARHMFGGMANFMDDAGINAILS